MKLMKIIFICLLFFLGVIGITFLTMAIYEYNMLWLVGLGGVMTTYSTIAIMLARKLTRKKK